MTDYDSSNQRHISIAKRQAKVDEDAERVFLNTVMGVAIGRAYIYKLLAGCHIFSQPFDPDPHINAFLCGERNIGQRLLADVMLHCPDHYVTMMREANARDIAAANRRSRSDEDANGGDNIPTYVHPGDDSPPTTDSDEERGFGREDGGYRRH